MANSTNSSPLLSNLFRLLNPFIIIAIGYLTLYLRFNSHSIPNNFYDKFIFCSAIFFTLLPESFLEFNDGKIPLKTITNLTKKWVTTLVFLLLVILFTQSGNFISRIWLLSWAIFTWVILIVLHISVFLIFQKLHYLNFKKKRVAIIGDSQLALQLINRINNQNYSEYSLIAHIVSTNQKDISRLALETLDEIWVAPSISVANQLPTIIKGLDHSPANIKYAPDLFTLRLINHGSSEVLGVEMLSLNASPFQGEALLLKNVEDFIISLCILIALCPLMLLVAFAVKISSTGPVFYKQERVGLNGRPFLMLKFRTMPVDIEKHGARWGNSDSKVVHPIAMWMRKLNLDELPQFINVLRGEMSIVGPRPERSEFIGQFREQIPNYMKKHLVKAGITGWAQVHGLRGDTDLNERIEYDLYYIENWSLRLDLKIILMTFLQTIGIKK